MADTWCMWDGSKGINCQSDAKEYLRLESGLPIGGGEANYNDNGYYKLTRTQPTLDTATETKDAEVWAKVDNQISLTWTVRDLTQDELDEITAQGVLDWQLYHVLKWMATEGYINPATAPQGLKDAYLARQRLEE